MNLLMVRHGEIPSNVNKVYAGTSAEKLTDIGIRQAEKVAEELVSFNVCTIYSSPIQRALQTAAIIGKRTGKDVLINDSFREMELGPWEGLSEKDAALNYPDEWNTWQTRPADMNLRGRETLDELLQRVLEGIRNIYREAGNTNIVIVTHVAIIRVILLWHTGKNLNLYKTIQVPNAEIIEIKSADPSSN